MGAKWTSPVEWEWLWNRIPEYNKAVERGEKTDWIKGMSAEFMKLFPIKQGKKEDIERYGEEKALEMAIGKREEALKWWFPNNTRVTSTGGVRGALKPKKKKKLQEWQVYQRKYWSLGLEDRVRKECLHTHGKELKDFAPRERFAVRNKLVQAEYAKESPEVRREIRELRDSQPETEVPPNEQLAKNIARLPRSYQEWGNAIEGETGWFGIMIFGGPHPLHNGSIQMHTHLVGKTKTGLAFDEYMDSKGKKSYRRWVREFNNFLHECFDDDDMAMRALNSKVDSGGRDTSCSDKSSDESSDDSSDESPSPPSTKSKEKSKTNDASASNDHKGDEENSKSDKENVTVTKTSKRAENLTQSKSTTALTDANHNSGDQSSKSNITKSKSKSNQTRALIDDYEMERTINMAKMKVVMAIIDNTVDAGKAPSALEEELKAAGIELSAERIQEIIDSVHRVIAPLGGESNSANPNPQDTLSPSTASTSQSVPAPDTSTTASQSKSATAQGGEKTTAAQGSNDDDASPTASQSKSATAQGGEKTTAAQGNNDDDVTPQDEEKVQENNEVAMDVDGEEGGGVNDKSAENTVTASQSSKEQSTQDDEAPMSLEHTVPPAFMKPVWPYLLGVSITRIWRSLLLKLTEFEGRLPPTGKMPHTKHRPKAIATWIRSHKKNIPPEIPSSFLSNFLAWYTMLQPDWRTQGIDGTNPSKFSRDVPPDASWVPICQGGSAGFYTVVMAVSWWIVKTPNALKSPEVAAVVKDMAWVLEQMTASLPPTSTATKRNSESVAEQEESTQGRKRSRRSKV